MSDEFLVDLDFINEAIVHHLVRTGRIPGKSIARITFQYYMMPMSLAGAKITPYSKEEGVKTMAAEVVEAALKTAKTDPETT